MSNLFYFTYEKGLVESKSLEELNHQSAIIKKRGGDIFVCNSVAELQRLITQTPHTVVMITLTVSDEQAESLRELNDNARDFLTDHMKHFGCFPTEMAIIIGEIAEHDEVVDIDILMLLIERSLQRYLVSNYLQEVA